MTTFYAPALAASMDLDENAAHHARVKRLAPGDPVDVTDGKGRVGSGRIVSVGTQSLRVEVAQVREVDRPSAIHLCVPVADKERMLWLAEKAAELQVASWTPVMYERSKSVSPRGEGESFDRKVRARMIAALEQSGGAWLPEIHAIRSIADITAERGIVMNRGGRPLDRAMLAAPVTIAVGPEGGLTPAEVATFNDRGWITASLGDITLRFETAAIGAVAVARALLF